VKTALTRLVGVEHPVVQTGMGWVAGPQLVAATAEAGGLGILASATMNVEELEKAIAATRNRTSRPFGVNLRADAVDAEQRIDLLIKEKIRVASFARAPQADLIKKLKDAGVVVIPSIGAVRHAEKVAAWGADAVIAQGAESGGHTGQVATTLLIPSVVDAVDIPVIAAGGFFDGRGLAAALSYGAAGIAMGTRFLLTKESTVPDSVKQLYLARGLDGTVVTKRVDGLPHRVLRTELVEKLERSGPLRGLLAAVANAARFKKFSGMSWSTMLRDGRAMRREMSLAQVIMAANTPMLLRAGLVEGRTDAGVLAAGQVVGMLDSLPTCAEVITGAVSQATEILEKLTTDLAI
jgi:NAD(P)H-dependent flavin oxidoreductase YrpB (nitropropane dioxygenase family)